MGWAHAEEKRIENNQINESLPGGIRYIQRLKVVERRGLKRYAKNGTRRGAC